jgi:hypothetical protein
MSNNIIKILIDNINSSDEENFTREICNNIIKQNLRDLNEDNINNIINNIFQNEESITKKEILNKLSLLNTENKNTKDNKNDNNKKENNINEDININFNEEEIIKPSNNIKMPVINIKPREHKNRDINNNTNLNKELVKTNKDLLNYETTKNKIETKNKIFDKMNIFKNEFFTPKNSLPSRPLPINIKTTFSSEIKSNNTVKKYNKINLGIKNYNINDEKQRKEYVNDIKGKLKNFAEEKKVRENKEKKIKSPFDDINDLIEKFQSKKKE